MDLLQFSLLDMTPYDKQSWFNLVGNYNQSLWPFNLLAALLSVLMPLLIFLHSKLRLTKDTSVRVTLGLLGVSWLWCGAVFHWQYFANLNWAAPWFGWVFIVQGGLLVLSALLLKQNSWVSLTSARGVLASILLLAGVLVYPLSGLLEGRALIALEWFPLLPASVTLVSFAVLMLLNTRWRHVLVVIPLLWAIVSGAFATTLELLEFYFMAAAVVFWLLHLFTKKQL